MQKSTISIGIISMFSLFTPLAFGQTAVEECVLQQFKSGNGNLTLTEIREICEEAAPDADGEDNSDADDSEFALIENTIETPGVITKRMFKESRSQFDPYVITPHKMNYVLPIMATNKINKDAYTSLEGFEENLENIEAKFQLSLKVPLSYDSMLIEGDGLYMGFTLEAWWQVYAENISKPFRETNYQPEIFYLAPMNWHPFEGNTGLAIGIEHQSNGRGQILSRSWNRVYANFLYEKDNFALSFKPWLRIAEDAKESEFDPDGDDNPDIADYMGNFELGMVYQWRDYELSFKGRRNFSTNYGAAEIGLTFPLWGKLRGYATAFSGYGESLIDYDHKQTRVGLGIALNNVL
jgi:phospholipase A1